MITVTLKDNNVCLRLVKQTHAAFQQSLLILRNGRFRFNKENSEWVGPLSKFNEIRERLDDIDLVECHFTQKDIESRYEDIPLEQDIESPRRLPDYSLLNYPPLIGKHPYENFQKQGISTGINKSRYAFCWQMGSGKSYVAAAIIAHRLYKYKDCGKVLFITSNIGVRVLKNELIKFIKDLDLNKIVIADKDFRDPFDHPEYDIVVTSYCSFRLICDYYKKKLKITSKTPRKSYLPISQWANNKEAMIILDESHNIANPTSIQSHNILLHSSYFKYRYIFTGTFADKPEKQFSQLSFLTPSLVWNLSYNEWKMKLANIGNRFSMYAITGWKQDELEKQNKRFDAYHTSYKTDEILDLPDYREQRVYLDMNPNHRTIYQEVIVQDLADKTTAKDIINHFPYMMLAVDNPHLLEKHEDKFDDKLNKYIKNFKDSYLEKIKAVEDIIGDHPDEKIIIWAIHPLSIHMLGEYFKKYNPICITGETKQQERFDLVNEFKTGDHKLLIANIQCLSTSVTITEASVQIYYERGFTYVDYQQSSRRIWRAGATKDVTTYILMYNNSLDVMLDKTLESKGMLTEGLINKNFISQEDWQKIFNCKESDRFEL